MSNLPADQRVAREYPCHEWARRDWCDSAGPGGFMGHTCITRVRLRLERDLDYEASRLRVVNEDLNRIEHAYGEARRKLDAFNERYGK